MARRVIILALALVLAAPLAVAALVEPPFPEDPLPGAASSDPALVGRWSAPFEGQVPAISMVLLDDGRILYWGGVTADDHDQVFFLEAPHVAEVAILAPPYDAASVTYLPNPEGMGDLFCAGLTILGDGRVLVAGGSDWKRLGENMTGFVDGVSDAWTFDPATTSWTREDDMDAQRWYPTVMTTSDGNALAVSGIAQLPQPQTLVTSLERYDGAVWRDAESDNLLPMYPRLFTVPSGPMKGDIFYETDATLWGPFGEHPLEPTWSLEQVLDVETNTWSVVGPSLFGARQHANTVMLPLSAEDGYTARLLTLGGSLWRSEAATNLVEMTTLGPDGVANDLVDPMSHPRWFPNTVILPDGSLLTTGGALYDNVYAHGQRAIPVMAAERFDPETGAWTQMASMTVPRTYHSTSMLLPDGRVLVGGHVPLPVPWRDARDNLPYQSQIAETRFEIFEPTYLFDGPRPEIGRVFVNGSNLGASGFDAQPVGYGQEIFVETTSASEIVDAILVHPGATTHAWDVNQRAIELSIGSIEDGSRQGVYLTMPEDADVAMPGPWMLFLRAQGERGLVPSVARFVTLG